MTKPLTLAELARESPAWLDPEPVPAEFLLHTLHADPLIATLLYRRGIRDAQDAADFLDARRRPPPSESIVPNMPQAIARIAAAIDHREHIGIFGDYDVDGVTATALLTRALRTAISPDHVFPILPERTEGYGLDTNGIDKIVASGASLLICVDCGSSDHEEVAYAIARGLDVVILDHHQMTTAGPTGAITASPQLSPEPTHHQLTGVGLAYLLVLGLAAHGHHVVPVGRDEAEYLDLVALGTVADVQPLLGINRIFVREGLEVLRRTRRPGLTALIGQTRLSQKGLDVSQIAFQLAPRINAAGRLATATDALNMLVTDDVREASRLAIHLNQLNLQRRSKQDAAIADAMREILARPDWQDSGFVTVSSKEWEPGLIGVIAGRLCETLRRPVIVFREEQGILTGSGRSVAGFDIAAALRNLDPLLDHHGGHAQAAGVTMRAEHLAAFTSGMLDAVAACGTEIPAKRVIRIDADLDDTHVNINTVRNVAALEPFGHGNPQPVLRIRNARLTKYSSLSDGKHLKLFVKAGTRSFEALLWNGGWRSRELVRARTLDLAGRLEINEFNGSTRLQMTLEDFRTTE